MDIFGFPVNEVEIVVFSALGLVFLIQVIYYFFFYGRIFFYKDKTQVPQNYEPVSLIICARNEEESLRNNLPAIVTQKYPNFEVVVVNDCSEDETVEVLKQFAAKYPHFRYTTIKKDEKFTHGKKLAVTLGIKSSRYDLLLFTDADCVPQSDTWLLNMVEPIQGNCEICVGYSGFHRKKGFLNMLLRYDAFFVAMHYFSFAMAGMSYMGVGRNLAYRKHLFFDNKGFAKHLDLDSGDDDLFINEIATKNNVSIKLQAAAQTKSYAPTTMSRWMRQKVRHRSTFSRYRFKHCFWLSVEPISRLLFYIVFAGSFFFTEYFVVPLAVFGLRLFLQLIVNYFWAKRLNEKDLFLFSPVSDIISIFTGLNLVYKGMFGVKKSAWK